MFEFISKKIADIKILHEGYTADYFLNRMKPNALFAILFIQNNKKKKIRYRHFLSDYCTCAFLEKFYGVIFCFLVLIVTQLVAKHMKEISKEKNTFILYSTKIKTDIGTK
jgi:hypothetical protein